MSQTPTNPTAEVFEPTEDSKATQRAAILAHLKQHGCLGTLEARARYKSHSVAARVLELRRAGVEIHTTRDPVTRCAIYSLGEVAQ